MNEVCESCDALIGLEDCTVKGMKAHVEKIQSELITEKNKLADALSVLKHERVSDQKKMLDLQRRLGFAMEEYEQDKTKLLKGDTLMGVNLNSEENTMRCKVDDIMTTLRDKIVASARDNTHDIETNKFINKISMNTSLRGSADSPKRDEGSYSKLDNRSKK